MAKDRHMARELEVMRRFAVACPMPIDAGSIEKREKPEPDILCSVEDGRKVAFELVESIDKDLARRDDRMMKMQKSLREAFEALPDRDGFRHKYKNALVHVTFRNDASARATKQSASTILEWLAEREVGFVGDHRIDSESALAETVEMIRVRRGRYVGPIFNVESAAWIDDPVVDRVEEKFGMEYQSKYPMELVVYCELQPVLPEDSWLLGLEAAVQDGLEGSPFRRVWVFDMAHDTIAFVYPEVLLRNRTR